MRLHALGLGHQFIEQQQDRSRGVDGHGGGDLPERQASEKAVHIPQGVDGHTHPSHLSPGKGVV